MLRFTSLIAVAAGLLLQAAVASAFPSLVDQVVATYPNATNLATCGTCHVSFDGSNAAVNAYGAAYAGGGFSFENIEGDDSDGDGTSNIDEIDTDAGFFPGWTCENYITAEAAPGNLADLVDPVDPGCDGTTTTTAPTSTTITTTTTVTVTSTSTTTTTVPAGEPSCGDPVAPFDGPVATDCLFVLQSAVGAEQCEACICDVTGSANGINATDALACLKVAVGEPLTLECPPCNGGSTTTTTTGGGTTTTTTGGETTTTTTGGGTTTTTAGEPTTTTTSGPTTTSSTTTTESAPTTTETSTTTTL